MPRGSAVIRYDGARGTVWRIKYADAAGQQVMETIGAERDGITRKMAEAELRERLVRVERKAYRRPRPLTFAQYAETWHAEGTHSRGWKPATIKVYRNAIDAYLIPAFGPTRLDTSDRETWSHSSEMRRRAHKANTTVRCRGSTSTCC